MATRRKQMFELDKREDAPSRTIDDAWVVCVDCVPIIMEEHGPLEDWRKPQDMCGPDGHREGERVECERCLKHFYITKCDSSFRFQRVRRFVMIYC